MSNQRKVLKRIKSTIQSLKEKTFTVFFFVIDSQGVPNGSLAYIYNLAKTLSDKGYNVKMLYQLENEYTEEEKAELDKTETPYDMNRVFDGVGKWLGEEYASLPHMNIMKHEWKIAPEDFLFIPEAFTTLMQQTYKHKAPCRRIVVLQNFDYVTDFIPLGVEWKHFAITDAIATSQKQAELLWDVFPYVETKILPPSIPEYFRKPIKPQSLIVNVVAKRQSDVNRIVKPFFWKYPVYRFISFRDLRGFPREKFAELLQEGAITVWIDTETPFGYSALEAMRCGNILIGKIPENPPEWMMDGNTISTCGFWVYDINTIPELLSKIIASWMQDKLPNNVYEEMEKKSQLYSNEEWDKNVTELMEGYIKEQIKNFTKFADSVKNGTANVVDNETNLGIE